MSCRNRAGVIINNVVANINLDMFPPLFPLEMVRGHGLSESDLGDRLRAAAEVSSAASQPPIERRFVPFRAGGPTLRAALRPLQRKRSAAVLTDQDLEQAVRD